MFAIITPALITGAFTNRVTFKAYLIFLVVWQLAVYYPFVHMLWGGGLLAHWGARDFAGGIVVHASAGFAALASVLYVGKRKFVDSPHNIPFIALGTGLLWFGWYGFNAGSELKVDDITALAFLNTDLAASFAAVTWLFVEWRAAQQAAFRRAAHRCGRRPRLHHARGRLRPIYASVVIGIAAGLVCYYAIQLKNRLKWDDALDVWGVHGVGGLLGIVLLGVFAAHCDEPERRQGLIHGTGRLLRQAGSRRPRLLPLRVRIHLRDAAGDRLGHAGASRGGCGKRPRRGDARRESRTPDADPMSLPRVRRLRRSCDAATRGGSNVHRGVEARHQQGRPCLRDRRRHRPGDRLLRRHARLREGRRRPDGPGHALGRGAVSGAETTIAIVPPPQDQDAGGSQTGICLDTSNLEADHATLKAAGADVDEEITASATPCRRCSGCATLTATRSSSFSRRADHSLRPADGRLPRAPPASDGGAPRPSAARALGADRALRPIEVVGKAQQREKALSVEEERQLDDPAV